MSNLIKLENIIKSYVVGDQTIDVLKWIDLEINEWEFVSITGQSGSGKTTLMNIIWMLDNPTTWNYFFNSENVADITDDEQALIRRLWYQLRFHYWKNNFRSLDYQAFILYS